MPFVFADEALADLAGAVAFLATQRPRAALRLIDRAFALAEQLAANALEGPEIEIEGEHVRSWPLPPYRVLYRREAARVVILRVYHQKRRPLA